LVIAILKLILENNYFDMTTRIGVVVRVRPLLEHEIAQNMKETKLFVNK